MLVGGGFKIYTIIMIFDASLGYDNVQKNSVYNVRHILETFVK